MIVITCAGYLKINKQVAENLINTVKICATANGIRKPVVVVKSALH